jgi:hypothetical protein
LQRSSIDQDNITSRSSSGGYALQPNSVEDVRILFLNKTLFPAIVSVLRMWLSCGWQDQVNFGTPHGTAPQDVAGAQY